MRFGIRDSGFGKARKRRPPALDLAFSNPESRIPNPGRAQRAAPSSILPRGAGEEAKARSALFHKGGGFTLLEVIAAIALLAIAFTVLMRVADGSTRLSENAADHSEAALWARSLLDTAFTSEPVRPGSTSGRFDQRFRWQLDVTPWRPGPAPAQAPLQLYQLDLAVSWGPAIRPQTAHFRTLRLAAAEPAQALP